MTASPPTTDIRILRWNGREVPSAEVELGSTRLIAGRFSSTINSKISAIEVSSFAQ
jgi:hypothetical protein